MRKVRVERGPSTDQGTFTRWILLQADGAPLLEWPGLELPWRQNRRGISCIKADTLRGRLVNSPHFKRAVYLFENKNGRESIELHPLNFAGDVEKGWQSQEHGCNGIGRTIGELENIHGQMQRAILKSGPALDEFIAATKGEDIEVTWVWTRGNCPPDDQPEPPHGIAKPGLMGHNNKGENNEQLPQLEAGVR
jgi:hypothetical protein